ncbi:hypothetical protein K443DRAFT_134674 [Laccaria amethystina LaAM-08-1]|uniref:Uncharacterized protein n=1 Tax=Laccaria amethystina LaAM-08-1 TaxID=1095629 RepID=A0A0C9XER7_9AGAR|nr:hypothetical protein K443DRAFT_134674 [Laccaria amethystina LaAM-08-1]
MTRRKWTTSDQEEWLKSRLSDFSDAQANKTTSKEFFPAILKDWRNAWPTATPTPEEVTKAGNVEKATQKKRADKESRIRAWFHNHMRGATSGNGARGLLKIGKQKALQDWQVYHVMTYKTQWKTVVDEEWEKYKSAWEAKNTGEEPEETRFTFMASFMRQKYQEESEEVRNNVKKRQEELKAELETEGEDKNHAYQNAINRLPRTLAVWGESVTKQTGWNITFLVGGPAPNQNGKIMSYL